jgi:hypothetical protein
MGGWAEDGMTYYIGQQFRGVGGIMPTSTGLSTVMAGPTT